MEPDDLLCSRAAHDKNVLIRCAQWKISQSHPLKRTLALRSRIIRSLV